MPFVSSDQFPTQGVDHEHFLCFKVTGKFEDLHTLARQIKHKYIASGYTVIVTDDRINDQCELLVIGDINISNDRAYELVEQRISEGFDVQFAYGRYFRSSFVYTFHEEPVEELPVVEEIEDHPF